MSRDPISAFLDTMPEIARDESFSFACHPGVTCFNACCSDLVLPLTPYDVLRLRQALGCGSEAFIDAYADISCFQDTGFPLFYLRMEADVPKQCPFLRLNGCSVYPHRPSACRIYPLGRASCMEDGQLRLRYFMVKEKHCLGFAESRLWLTEDWLVNQGLIIYHEYNDLFYSLLGRHKALKDGTVLAEKYATLALLALYQQDSFQEFIVATGLLERLEFIGPWAGLSRITVEHGILNDEVQRLVFGLSWMELVLLKKSALLKPRL